MDMGTSLVSDFVINDKTACAKLALTFHEMNFYESSEKNLIIYEWNKRKLSGKKIKDF